jgi:uncharacterized damage-inducible protein DinB
MGQVATLLELSCYCRWANEQILSRAAALPAARLAQSFDMGVASLDRTMQHVHHGESTWLERCRGNNEARWPSFEAAPDPAGLAERLRSTAAEREGYLRSLDESALQVVLTYRDSRGCHFQASRFDMVLQQLVHSAHHRAQALNMLRQLGAELPDPGLDYIFMRRANPNDPPPAYDLATIRRWLAYGDARQRELFAASVDLPDEALDRPFEMGLGTLRATLLHIRFGEQWWLENWTLGPGRPFPELGDQTPVAQAAGLFDQTVRERDRFLDGLSDADLSRAVAVEPRPGVVRRFPLGVTLLQTCHHGVHHRAQAVNMLRRVGGPRLEMDYMTSVRVAVA